MDLSQPRDLTITCAPGLVPYLERELGVLEIPLVRSARTTVTVHGDWTLTWRLCLWLRTALQVLYPLHEFRCRSADDLYAAVRGLAWEDVIAPDGYLTVESRVHHPSINNSMFPNLRVKDAIVDRVWAHAGRRPDSGPERRGVVVHLIWHGERATIALNAAGRKLADRGYRRSPHRAPLQETLAAGVMLATGWTDDRPLVLPMCGSGTLAVEAILIALDRAPGLLRGVFGFSHVLGFDERVWKDIRGAARRAGRKTLRHPVRATDIDPQAIEAAQRNVETAGVAHLVELDVAEFEETRLPEPPGVLVVNPEYGARLGDEETLGSTYEKLGSFFKGACAGWRCFVLSGNKRLSARLGLKARRRYPFFNAEIECRLLEYEMWSGRRTSAGDVEPATRH